MVTMGVMGRSVGSGVPVGDGVKVGEGVMGEGVNVDVGGSGVLVGEGVKVGVGTTNSNVASAWNWSCTAMTVCNPTAAGAPLVGVVKVVSNVPSLPTMAVPNSKVLSSQNRVTIWSGTHSPPVACTLVALPATPCVGSSSK
jgi:hypothetical protein